MVGDGVAMVFGFPECTDLTVAGARHFAAKRQANPLFQIEAAELADLVRIVGLVAGAPWAFENPVGVLSSIYRKPDFAFQPCDFAGYLPEEDEHPLYPDVYPGRDRYNKTTNIWCGNGFRQPRSRPMPALSKDNPGWRLCGGKSTRTKNIRSEWQGGEPWQIEHQTGRRGCYCAYPSGSVIGNRCGVGRKQSLAQAMFSWITRSHPVSRNEHGVRRMQRERKTDFNPIRIRPKNR